MGSDMPWNERVPMLSVNPSAASTGDGGVARSVEYITATFAELERLKAEG